MPKASTHSKNLEKKQNMFQKLKWSNYNKEELNEKFLKNRVNNKDK